MISSSFSSCFVDEISAQSEPSSGLMASLTEPGDVRQDDVLDLLFSSPVLGRVALNWGPIPRIASFLRYPKEEPQVVRISTKSHITVSLKLCTRPTVWDSLSLGPEFEKSLDPVAFFWFAKGGLLPLYLPYYKNRKLFQGVAGRIEMFCH